MSFLISLLTSLLTSLLSKLGLYILKEEKQREDDNKIESKTKAEAQAVVDAKTPEQKDIADRDLLSGL